MSVFDYAVGIKLTFDRAIVNSPETILGTEYYRPAEETMLVALSSGYYNSSYVPSKAFDGDTGSFWRSSSTSAPQWIGKDFGKDVTLTKIIARFEYSSGRPNAYQLQGSVDGVNWVDVATGNFANASGEQPVTFSPVMYRYWRLYFTSKHSSYYTCSELSFWNTRNTYKTDAWRVYADEPAYTPDGPGVQNEYTVRRVTKSENNLSLFLWLSLSDRMLYPLGQVNVEYIKAIGNLRSSDYGRIDDFAVSFSASNLTILPKPRAVDYLTMSPAAQITSVAVIRSSYKSSIENIQLVPSAVVLPIHINDLEE